LPAVNLEDGGRISETLAILPTSRQCCHPEIGSILPLNCLESVECSSNIIICIFQINYAGAEESINYVTRVEKNIFISEWNKYYGMEE
jgi:hypothetical protein